MLGSKIVLKKRTKVRHLPGRMAAGGFILDSAMEKLDSDDDTAKRLHGFASQAYPLVADMEPRTFLRALTAGELALGGALILPFVPSWLAGLGLAGFAGGLLNLYAKTPGLHRQGSLRPTADGRALAKDVWMLGIAAMLVLDRESWFRRR